jgi:hypothetical protein
MDSSVMAEKQISAHKSASTLCTLEGSLLGMGTLVSAPVLTSAECAVTELALVLLLWHE